MWTPVTAGAGGEEQIHTRPWDLHAVCVSNLLFVYLCVDQLDFEDRLESGDILVSGAYFGS